MKHIITTIISCFFILSLSSCSKNESEKRIEYAKSVESRTTQDKLNDLYVGSDGDIEALARVLQVTPASIERLRKGETEPTQNFEERLTDASLYYFMNGQSFSKLQSILDEEYGWYDSVLNFPSHHPWWFWGVTIGLFLLTCCFFFPPAMFLGGWGMIIELLIFLVAWIMSFIFSPTSIEDKYVDTINPVIETIL